PQALGPGGRPVGLVDAEQVPGHVFLLALVSLTLYTNGHARDRQLGNRASRINLSELTRIGRSQRFRTAEGFLRWKGTRGGGRSTGRPGRTGRRAHGAPAPAPPLSMTSETR